MVLTSFGNIGKSAKDLFTKHFKFNLIDLDFKSTTENDVDVHIECKNVEKKLEAATDVTFKPADGISVKTKIDSDWVISSDVEVKEKFQSMKHNIIATLNYVSGEKKLKLKNSLQRDNVNGEIEMDFASMHPSTTASFVVGDQGYFAGAQVLVDTKGFELKKHIYSLGYAVKDFEVSGAITNHRDLEWKLYQNFRDICVGVRLGLLGGLNNTEFGMAAMYKPNKDTFIKGRIDQRGDMAIAYGFKPIPEIQMVVAMKSFCDLQTNVASGLSFEISN